MLYDPKWEAKTKPDVFSLESLIAWLEKQPADGKYDYVIAVDCLVSRYGQAIGDGRFCDLSPMGIEKLGRGWSLIARGPDGISSENCRSQDIWTYGAALERARAALS